MLEGTSRATKATNADRDNTAALASRPTQATGQALMNSSPNFALFGATEVAYTEAGAAVALSSSATVYDAELAALNGGAGNYAGASLTLTRQGGAVAEDQFSALGDLSFVAGSAVLSGTEVGTVTQAAGSLTLSFNGNATQAAVNQVLISLAYANSSVAPPASVQIDWTFSDGNAGAQGTGGALTTVGSTVVSITGINEDVTGAVTIAGNLLVGQTLTAVSTLADADGLGALSYQWQVDGDVIDGATNSTYLLQAADAGKPMSVLVSYTDVGGAEESFLTDDTGLVANATALENGRAAVTVIAPVDPLLGTRPVFSLAGDDMDLFKVTSKGVVTFITRPDFEQPTNFNEDGVYAITVEMTNAKTDYVATQDLFIRVEFVPILGTTSGDRLYATRGWDTLDGLAGNDRLSGGIGRDTFHISAGNDRVTDFNRLDPEGYGEQEILQVAAGASVKAMMKEAWVATDESFNLGGAELVSLGMDVDLSEVTLGAGWQVTNKGQAATLTGSVFNDTLSAGRYSDTLNGGDGNDVLIGGLGADTLTGGLGADQFRLNGNRGTSSADALTDFESGTDRIELQTKIFKSLGLGQITADEFVSATAAQTATQNLVYDTASGELFYDADGSGARAQVLIGMLDPGTVLAVTDLWGV